MHAPPRLATLHGRGETDVELQLIAWEDVGRWIDRLHARGWRCAGRGDFEDSGDFRLLGPEHRAILDARAQREARLKNHRAVGKIIRPEYGRHIALTGIDGEDLRPILWFDGASPAGHLEQRRIEPDHRRSGGERRRPRQRHREWESGHVPTAAARSGDPASRSPPA